MYYKDPTNRVHALSASDVENGGKSLLPPGAIEIGEAEARALTTPTPDPKAVAQTEIDALERREMLPRVVREYLLVDFATKASAVGKSPADTQAYVKLKALDDQIKVLRVAAK